MRAYGEHGEVRCRLEAILQCTSQCIVENVLYGADIKPLRRCSMLDADCIESALSIERLNDMLCLARLCLRSPEGCRKRQYFLHHLDGFRQHLLLCIT